MYYLCGLWKKNRDVNWDPSSPYEKKRRKTITKIGIGT